MIPWCSPVVDAIRSGRAVYDWHPLDVSARLRIWVFRDALKVDGVRANVSARDAQRAADLLGATLTTPAVEDLIWAHADVRIEPFTGDPARRTAADHSADIDHALNDRPGLVCTVGKSWVLAPGMTEKRAVNYGWHGTRAAYASQTLPGIKVWQQPGTRHNLDHADYSQTLRLMRRRCTLDGVDVDVRDLLCSDELHGLLSDRKLAKTRQPGIDEDAPDTDRTPIPSGVLVLPEIVIYGRAPIPQPLGGDVDGVAFIQARNYTPGRRASVRNVVIHTAETGETNNAAENLAKWAAGASAPRASWHYAVDADTATQSVLERDTAWHAPGVNGVSIGIEHAGRAGQVASGWGDPFSVAMLGRSARLVAGICERHGIPVERVGPKDLIANAPGICGHVDVSRAFRKSDHWDPGKSFPWDHFLALVRGAA